MATKTLKEAVKAIEDAIEEAERISEETGEGFSIHPAYGMGGYYEPRPKNKEQSSEEDDWEDSWDDSEDEDETYGWHASSQSC